MATTAVSSDHRTTIRRELQRAAAAIVIQPVDPCAPPILAAGRRRQKTVPHRHHDHGTASSTLFLVASDDLDDDAVQDRVAALCRTRDDRCCVLIDGSARPASVWIALAQLGVIDVLSRRTIDTQQVNHALARAISVILARHARQVSAHDATPWCVDLVVACLKAAHTQGTASLVAASLGTSYRALAKRLANHDLPTVGAALREARMLVATSLHDVVHLSWVDASNLVGWQRVATLRAVRRHLNHDLPTITKLLATPKMQEALTSH